MEISSSVIPVPRNAKPGWYEKFRENNFLIQKTSAKLLLIGDSLISNLSRYPDIWNKYFTNYNTLNFGISGDKVQNILWRISNYDFSNNSSIKCVFILGGTNNIDHNSPEEIVNGLITSGLSAQSKLKNAKIVIIPLLPRDSKSSMRRGNIDIINNLLFSECSKHSLYTFSHQREWLNSDRSLNMSLFYKDGLHLIRNGNEILAKEILNFYQSLKSKFHTNAVRSFKDATSFSLNDSSFPPLHSTSTHQMPKNYSDQKSHLLPTNKPIMPTCLNNNMYISVSRAYMLPTSPDDIFMSNSKSSYQSIQSFVNVSSSSSVCPPSTSVCNHVTKKAVTCRSFVTKCSPKCPRKSTTAINRNIVNHVSKPVNNVVNHNRSTSVNSSDFVHQPRRHSKSLRENVISSVVNKSISPVVNKSIPPVVNKSIPPVVNKSISPVNVSERFYPTAKCEKKICDSWKHFLILFLLVTLGNYFLNKTYCYFLKANIIANNLRTYLLFKEYRFHDLNDCLGKIYFRDVMVYSNSWLYQYFFMSVNFGLFCKVYSVFSVITSLIVFAFFTITGTFLLKRIIHGLQNRAHNRSGKQDKLYCGFFSMLLGIANPYSQFEYVYHMTTFFYKILNFCFYVFENLIDIFIFLDFIFSMIGGLLKHLFLSCCSLLLYSFLTFLVVTNVFNNILYNNNFNHNFTFLNNFLENINISKPSPCLYNNVFLSGQEQTISAPTTANPSVTSYNPPYLLFHGCHLFKHFLKEKQFQYHKAVFALFNIFFSLF